MADSNLEATKKVIEIDQLIAELKKQRTGSDLTKLYAIDEKIATLTAEKNSLTKSNSIKVNDTLKVAQDGSKILNKKEIK